MKFKYLIILLFLFIISLSFVTAHNQTNDMDADNMVQNHTVNDSQMPLQKDKVIKKSITTNYLTAKNYDNYFQINSSTNQTHTTGQVYANDTINLEGTFKNVNFTLDKDNLTLTSINKSAKLINCTVYVAADNCRVYNLNINNTNVEGVGILSKHVNNISIINNSIYVQNLYAFGIACDNMTNSIVLANNITSKQLDDAPLFSNYKQCGLVLCQSHNNQILNNSVNCTFANGIYLSVYGSIFLKGGYSNNNLIEGNYVLGGDTVWCYTIQVMGSNNIVRNNTVLGGHRGISCEGNKNNTIIDNKINAIMQAIHASEQTSILNNTITLNHSSAVGVYTDGFDVVIKNNKIYSNASAAIKIASSTINISDNVIVSANSYGIYSKGPHQFIRITGNNISTQDTGIFFEKQSQKKKVNHIYLNNNKITSNSSYAVDFSQAGSFDIDQINVTVLNSNVLLSANGNGIKNAYRPPSYQKDAIEEKGINVTITQKNYNQYFNQEGIAKSTITKNSNVTLSGTFNDVNFQFTNQINIRGKNCIINMGTITLAEDASISKVSDILINNTKKTKNINRHAIELIEVNNCIINNITIFNYDLAESMGIFLYSSSGNIITNNNITSTGNLVNNAIFLYSSDINTIKNNSITYIQSNNSYEDYGEIMFNEKIGTLKQIDHEHAIILIYSSSNIIDHNIIVSKSEFIKYTKPNIELANKFNAIKIYYDSHLNNITYNQLYIDSYGPYTQALGVIGAFNDSTSTNLNSSLNLFRKNTVKANGGYLTQGCNIEKNAINTIITENSFTVTPRKSARYYADYGYGIRLDSSQNTIIQNNNITVKGSATYPVELYNTKSNIIQNNTFKVKGTKACAVASEKSAYNTVKENIFDITIKNYGSTEGNIHKINPTDKAILLTKKSHNNSIAANTIKTNGSRAVYVDDDSVQNNITNNSLQDKSKFGDDAVDNHHETTKIQNNYLYPIKISVKDTSAIVGKKALFTATMSSRTNDLKNVTATFRLGSNTIGTSKIYDNKATINYTIPSYFRSGLYDIIVIMGGTNFQNTTGRAKATITQNTIKTIVSVLKPLGTPGDTLKINATVKDVYGNNMKGRVDFILDGKSIGTVNMTQGVVSVNYKIPANAAIKTYPLVVKYSGNGQYSASSNTTILGLQNKVVASVYYANATIGSNITFRAKFTQNKKALASGKVGVKINGITIGTTNIKDGIALLTYRIPVGYSVFQKHTVQFVYGGTDTLAAVRAERDFDLYQMKAVIQLNKTKAKVGQDVAMKVRITNTTLDHNAISGKVGLKINGLTVKNATTKEAIIAVPQKGMVTIVFKATQALIGNNNITVTYSGNNRLTTERKTFNNILTVTK